MEQNKPSGNVQNLPWYVMSCCFIKVVAITDFHWKLQRPTNLSKRVAVNTASAPSALSSLVWAHSWGSC